MKVLATFLLTAFPQLALADSSFLGLWCGDEGELVHINVEYLANGDSILCEFEEALKKGEKFDAPATCRSWEYEEDGTPVLGFELPKQLEAWLLDRDHLMISFGPETDAAEFVRCN